MAWEGVVRGPRRKGKRVSKKRTPVMGKGGDIHQGRTSVLYGNRPPKKANATKKPDAARSVEEGGGGSRGSAVGRRKGGQARLIVTRGGLLEAGQVAKAR